MTKQIIPTRIDFLGIGVQKAGTSWLYSNLNKLPEFDLPLVKEVHYFDRDPKYISPNLLSETRLVDRLSDFTWIKWAFRDVVVEPMRAGDLSRAKFYWRWYFSDYTDRWYLSLFEKSRGYTGEITPSYSILERPDIVRMHRILPDARLIYMVRNPIERAWSHYRFNTGRIPGYSFDAVKTEDILAFMKSDDQILRSQYQQTLDRYASVFPKDQILIGFYDAIIDAPEQLLNEVVDFITRGTYPRRVHYKTHKKVNQSREISMPPEVEAFLKDYYYEPIQELAATYGGYFHNWLEKSYGEKRPSTGRPPVPTISLV